MLIECLDGVIILHDEGNDLSSPQISQLSYWGFAKKQNKSIYNSQPGIDSSILSKLVRYFKTQNVSFALSEKCEFLFKNLVEKELYVEKLKAVGNTLKGKNFNDKAADDFFKFIDTSISRKLKPHQLKAALHLYRMENAANFSVPGSGKTTVVLSVYEKLKMEGVVNLLFVIGPPSCFGPWKTEYRETLNRSPSVVHLAGGNKESRESNYYASQHKLADIYLSTFQTVTNDQKHIEVFFKQNNVNVFLVLDEAHYIKQRGGIWSSAILNLSKSCKRRCVLTGTPSPKEYSDMFNYFEFLLPDYDLIDSKTKIKIQQNEEAIHYEMAKALLKEKINPFFVRTSKKELVSCPSNTFTKSLDFF